jgi:tetratricopeptide (TPR) repeat protein
LTLHSWLAEISPQELATHPRLLLLKGKILNDDLGEPGQAMTFYQQAEAVFRRQNDPVGAAETQVLRSSALRMTGQAIEAVEVARTALAELETLEADEQIMAWAIRTCGLAYGTAGNISEALAYGRRALEKFEALDDTYNVARCHQEIGVNLVAQGNIQGADHHYREAIRIWESLGNASDLANALNSLGVSLEVTGHYQEALNYFGESLDIALQIESPRRAAGKYRLLTDPKSPTYRYFKTRSPGLCFWGAHPNCCGGTPAVQPAR